jgi:hypothetical protein
VKMELELCLSQRQCISNAAVTQVEVCVPGKVCKTKKHEGLRAAQARRCVTVSDECTTQLFYALYVRILRLP